MSSSAVTSPAAEPYTLRTDHSWTGSAAAVRGAAEGEVVMGQANGGPAPGALAVRRGTGLHLALLSRAYETATVEVCIPPSGTPRTSRREMGRDT
ncbi:hypothetical protein Pta02_65810 [Planobispora takensis]|uniref:Uncharacterized protein n=1 Tax=Planobispora takensis TaxID=1367882 RepID=A0A8J3T2J4_9ACTN|nr:hypothetical protein Pta02_65810 [Planobispora takensis]